MTTENSGTSNLVIGRGEVGKAVQAVLECDGIDKGETKTGKYKYLHICIPYSDSFKKIVLDYQEEYMDEGGLLIIHSTVPLGTSESLNAVHSPIRGVHPNLEEGVRTFVKYFGGQRAGEASAEFIKKGVKCEITSSARNTEAGKLWSTTQYGLFIALQKEIHEYCEENGLDFDVVYTQFNRTYNEGYAKLDMPHVLRPILKHVDGPIGGHCIQSNASILHQDFGGDVLKMVLSGGQVCEREEYLSNRAWLYCEYWGKGKNCAEIGREIGYTGEWISKILDKHGIPKRAYKWTKEEKELIVTLHSQGLTFTEIADRLENRTYEAIRNIAYKELGLLSNYDPSEQDEATRRKISATLQGIPDSEWSGFIESENAMIRKSIPYKRWRTEVFERDGYVCVKCGDGGYINADHIKPFSIYPELRFDIENGQTLCVPCHKEKTKTDLEEIRASKNG